MAKFDLSDWIDIETIKAQSRHVSAILAVLISFALVGFVAKHLVPTQWEGYVDDIEVALLLLLFLFFGIRLLWEIVTRKNNRRSMLHAFVVA